MFRRALWAIPLWWLVAAGAGCASDYVARTRPVRQAYQSYQYPVALEALDRLQKEESGKDKLLVLLDQGMLLHASGHFQESIEALAAADRLAAQQDTISVSEEARTLLANERERAYRGEDFERLMINLLQALNYAELGKDEDALVEVRRVDLQLKKMITEEHKPYKQLAVARYISGVLYEDEGKLDDALIDYRKAYEEDPSLGHLADALVRVAKLTGRTELADEFSAAFPKADGKPLEKDEGEVVVVVENGLSPVKEADQRQLGRRADNLIAVPVFRDRWSPHLARVEAGGETKPAVLLTALDEVAKVHLNERIGRLLTRSLAGDAVKAGVAAGAGALTKDARIGVLAFELLTLMNQPDLRSWLSLPAHFQLARFRLPKGAQTVRVESGGRTVEQQVEIKPRRISVLTVRTY